MRMGNWQASACLHATRTTTLHARDALPSSQQRFRCLTAPGRPQRLPTNVDASSTTNETRLDGSYLLML